MDPSAIGLADEPVGKTEFPDRRVDGHAYDLQTIIIAFCDHCAPPRPLPFLDLGIDDHYALECHDRAYMLPYENAGHIPVFWPPTDHAQYVPGFPGGRTGGGWIGTHEAFIGSSPKTSTDVGEIRTMQ